MNIECVSPKTEQHVTNQINLIGCTMAELKDLVRQWGWEDFRTQQITSWVYKKGIHHFKEMTNLSQSGREFLEQTVTLSKLKLVETQVSERDGTIKFLFQLKDNEKIESVFMPTDKRRTLCLSTQVGCPLRCSFCLTGKVGFKRNLDAGEIIDQVISTSSLLSQELPLSPKQHPVTNVVFMGMGEPLLNWPEVSRAISILQSDYGPSIGSRKITVSTAGIADKIEELASDPIKFKLAISLNSADDDQRSYLMPINKIFPLNKLIKAVKKFSTTRRERVTFEYVLIDSLNDSLEDAKRLADLIRGIPCKINLIPYNEIPGKTFKAPSEKVILQFQNYLYQHCPAVTLRKSRGQDILGACGQLRACY
ncbi:MAG: 23S rRNA (adenine(2503)-C(2))-methyltransferase RlmN [Candidatus Tectomicrobia bacterium]|uniref:Probable dual-specificity RNA methyltransferase RlmN n=1 Tax=Tectimicrobiota bacterium TaxID=2528274 RepID=A0A933GLC9_UNCTE|nr:23S rRNA (adenine(2503)-C(2))-methyltransferase RlmN [Candidatus Tectomicrobia bacterium]